MSNPLFVGIDIALDDNRICLMNQEGVISRAILSQCSRSMQSQAFAGE